MENAVKTRLQSLQPAEPQVYKNIAILPLIAPAEGTLQYRTLGEALASSDLAITEVSEAGSVPDLLVTNRANIPVLLVDGEELAGVKQNRVLNTSILLKENSQTRIPVSCTEQGRWAYASALFRESGNVMAFKSRSLKSHSVHRSLESSGQHRSDQGEVWSNIAELQAKSGAHSPTSAMSDVYKARDEDLRKCDEIFTPVANQVGLLVFIAGAPAGLDLLSLTAAYARLHPKLVRSYALEALLDSTPSPPRGEGRGEVAPDSAPSPDASPSPPRGEGPGEVVSYQELAAAFLAEIAAAERREFPSIGHGTDLRYRSSVPKSATPTPHSITGSALLHVNEVIHAAFFRLDGPEQPERMAIYRSRRRHFSR